MDTMLRVDPVDFDPGDFNPDTAPWRTSTRSFGSGECVAVAITSTAVGVRDSKDPAGGHLVLPRSAFRTLIERVKAGDFDR